MHLPLFFSLLCLLFSHSVYANVEKTIFLAPSSATIPSLDPTLDDLGLERLSPLNPVLRTNLNASFPTTEAPLGTDSWFFLENLNPGQRYEVRICWLASQPTSFTLSTHTLANTIETNSLFTPLTIFSAARLASLENPTRPNPIPRNPPSRLKDASSADPAPTTDSVLFLRIQSVADYFSADPVLMETVPPVLVDIILDPFLLNVFPKSLVPTACWVTVVAGLALVIARWVSAEFGRAISAEASADTKRGSKKER
ncbi:hypothetical protein ASPWEDRAFT_25616 [Aspergillus wentii DTO 134E9]|uniref:Uncharacterized protein n=1 Tax=Aspergillus wentii DTO 134E9 TaxID=1073089 RepID=A0A1L9RXY9_ASPWE|nr:uncharacterized protein ASPWEDRAFT_25616 [Aspergillus wentii DTO 134E9]KAI9931511.1 hypothetical protein MW887_010086 [Aspergillus wentii]OJJ39820.1 hypothetical protein ASPWEDRAFT_25616 [Aspergillus wentii DTO 134E9]